MAEEIQLTPEQEALYNQSAQPQPINPLRDFNANQLAELAVQDKENFDLVDEFQRNQDLWGDAATVQKTADALDIVKQRGFELSDLPGPATIGKTVLESAKGFGKQLWNYADAAVGMAQGAIAEPFSTELATGFAEDVTRKLSSNIAGTEEAMAGLSQLPEKAISKAGRMLGGPRTPEQKVADLWKDVGRAEVQQQRLTGQGPFTQAVTGGIAGELPPEEVTILAAGDPFSFALFGGGLNLAGKLISGGVRAVAAKTGKALGTAAAVTGGRTVQAAGKLTELGANAVKTVAPTTGGIAGAIKGGALGGPLGVIPGIGVGAAGGRVIARGAKQISTAGAKVAEVGKQVAGAAPVTSALAQAGRDVLQSAPGATGAIGIGLVQDIGLAAVTSETPQETEGAIGIGTALGAAGAAGRVGRRVISGQLVAPREYGVNTVTPSSGNFPNLDTLHNQSIQNATPGEQTRLNAIRLFAKGSAPGTDIFFAKDRTALASALESSGVSAEQARLASQQEGFFTVSLPDKSGTPRRVIVSTNVEAAPHEAFHAVQDVLGEAANREIDSVVREAYADQWEQFGQDYANRLVDDSAGRDWRETILDESRKGKEEAVEKLSQSIGNEIRNQTGAEPAPGFVQDRVRAEWSRILSEAQQRNPNATAKQIWRDILSPEEATSAADRYIARELAAENFDVVFKNLGAALDSKQPLVRRLARTAANLIATFGGEPLSGRRSEIAQVEPRFAVTEAVTQASRPRKPVTIEPKRSGPVTAKAQQDASQQARTLASEATDTIQAGGTSSPRELLGQLAEAIAQRSGVKLNYLSAPGEPSGSVFSNRDIRRAVQEVFRNMPADKRAMWEKNFFPERVIQTKGGKYQIIGWSPEVFAANAHKLAGWLAEHPDVATPYAVDAATKSFTPEAWQQLFNDVQQFVRNQQAGATGAGGELVVPRSVTERGFTAPARTGGETALAQENADVINMLFGFKLPETPRVTKGRLPLAIAGEEVSAATLPGRVIEPTKSRAPFSGAEAEALGIAGRTIKEVNPFRKLVEESGTAPSMIEAVQRLNLENIKEAALAPELPEFRGNTLTLTAGFQPVAAQAKRLVDMTPEQWKSTITGYTGKLGGGLTGWAFDLGASAKNVADITALREAVTQLNEAARSISIADEGGFDRKMDLIGRGQAAREAFEAATGSNLEGTNEGSALPFIRKHIDSSYKPPVPGEVKPVLKMAAQPKSAGLNQKPEVDSLISEGRTQFQAGKGKRKKLDDKITVFHFSKAGSDLTKSNPKKMREEVDQFWGKENPKTFFFVEGSEKDPGEQFYSRSVYTSAINKSDLYDVTEKDPLGFFGINREEADYKVRKAGYKGVLIPIKDGRQVVIMYRSTPLKYLGESDADGNILSAAESSEAREADLLISSRRTREP